MVEEKVKVEVEGWCKEVGEKLIDLYDKEYTCSSSLQFPYKRKKYKGKKVKRVSEQEARFAFAHVLSNKEGYYWYHKKCRCKVCDRVRYLGYSKLNHSEKGKYNHIIWDNKKNQWNTKSKNQIRYEKEQKRKKNRR